jgi:hypothetical protein
MNMNMYFNTIGQPLAICLCRQFNKFNLNTDSQSSHPNASKSFRQAQILKSAAARKYSYVNNINGVYRYCVNPPSSSLPSSNFLPSSSSLVTLTNQSQAQNQTLSLQANILCTPPKRYISALGTFEGQPGGSQVSLKNSY